MNLKLEVIRINEDVIATSGLCQHIDGGIYMGHYYISNYDKNTGKADYVVYVNSKGKLIQMANDTNYSVSGYGVNKNGWWASDGSNFHYCEEQSNESHPISAD